VLPPPLICHLSGCRLLSFGSNDYRAQVLGQLSLNRHFTHHRVRPAPHANSAHSDTIDQASRAGRACSGSPTETLRRSRWYSLRGLDAATMVAKGKISMPEQRELRPVPPCTLPVNNLSLEPEYFGERPGRGYVRVPCKACGAQYDRREIEEYSHPYAHHVSSFMCPRATWAKRGESGGRCRLRQRIYRATEEVGAHAAFGKRWRSLQRMSSSLLVVHPGTLRGLRLRIIRVIHSSDFAVLRHNYRGINRNFSIFLGFAF
jgi:hypothetical protein